MENGISSITEFDMNDLKQASVCMLTGINPHVYLFELTNAWEPVRQKCSEAKHLWHHLKLLELVTVASVAE